MSYAIREAIWLKSLLHDPGIYSSTKEKFFINTDNQQVLNLSKDEIISEKSKHIDIKYHLVRDHAQQGTVTLNYVCTNDMIADILTKPLENVKFSRFRQLMGVHDN